MPILLVLLASVSVLFLGIMLLVPPVFIRNVALSGVEWLVHLSAPIAEVTPEILRERVGTDSSSVLLFDVREREEYDISHIAGAIQLSPSITSLDFTRLYGNHVRGKHIVFYCSVGKRSGDAALRIDSAARERGAISIENLRGGIFRWYNAGFEVKNAVGITQAIHPFNNQWKLLVRQ